MSPNTMLITIHVPLIYVNAVDLLRGSVIPPHARHVILKYVNSFRHICAFSNKPCEVFSVRLVTKSKLACAFVRPLLHSL